MTAQDLADKARSYLEKLCLDIPNRRVGSPGNRAATGFFAETVAAWGYAVETPPFVCIDWQQSGATLTAAGRSYPVFPSPYSLGCEVTGELAALSTLDELESVDLPGGIFLLRGDLAKEQLMPKNFPYFNPDHHQHIIRLLEERAPLAIVAATERNPELAGGLYPFPLIEDGDFDIPSVYMTAEDGARLAAHAGQTVNLASAARRIPAEGCNVIARKGDLSGRRVVLVAHIDAKIDSPGAIDNAAGVAVLLLFAELLGDHPGRLGVEIVAFNGEDYYAAPGEIQYFAMSAEYLDQCLLAINIDGAGYIHGRTAFSLYGCPADLARAVRAVFDAQEDMIEGEAWYQSDHAIFAQNQIPALAITSERFVELSSRFTHTPEDHPRIVDGAKLARIAGSLQDLVIDLDRKMG